MDIKPFKVEEWMNEYETEARYNIAETCVNSISLDELWELSGVDKNAFWEDFCKRRLTYGDIYGSPELKKGVCALYRSIGPDDIVLTHGAAGANHHVFYSLINPGDRIVSIMPTYQQLYSIPEAYKAEVKIMRLREENGYLPDMEELERLAAGGVKLICVNNPNNPTGALMSGDTLRRIAEIAEKAGAYVLCDEVYRHLTQKDEWCESIADIYEKGISVGSMSKVFSLAGLRLGWIASRDRAFIESCLSHRDYNLISCGMFDDKIAAVALENREAILERNRGIVRENLSILDEWVRGEERIHYFKPQAGTTALVHYEYGLDSFEFCKRMYHETGAFVTPGDCFEEEKCFRVGYANDKETLKNGLEAISLFLRKLESEGL